MTSLIVTTANIEGLGQPRRKMLRYTRMVKRRTKKLSKGKPCRKRRIIARQEVMNFGYKKSTRTRVWRLKRTKQQWKILSRGGHNGVSWRDIKVDGRTYRVMNAHGTHPKYVGRDGQAEYYRELLDWINSFPPRIKGWILAGDFNRQHNVLARYLGGRSVGHKIDGVIVSKNLDVELIEVFWKGVRKGLTDHPAVITKVRI